MVKLGLIALANDSGLGVQTRRLAHMLNPYRIMVIDSSGFSKNKKQHMDWYSSFRGYKVLGFPNNKEIRHFLNDGLTHVLVCENPFNFFLLSEAKRRGVKVFIQSNYEFCDHLNRELTPPHKFLMPSYWKVKEMKEKFGEDTVQYMPPPIFANEFKEARDENLKRTEEVHKKYLHIVGTLAAKDRNGTLDLLKAVKLAKSDFTLTIRSQHELPEEYMINDRRVRYSIRNEKTISDMYKGFDALILPRRYGGLSLTTNEALMSALPVIMPDISPNNELLPNEWLVRVRKRETFITRAPIDVYEVDIQDLADRIDEFSIADSQLLKINALDIGYSQFDPSVLKSKYEELFT